MQKAPSVKLTLCWYYWATPSKELKESCYFSPYNTLFYECYLLCSASRTFSKCVPACFINSGRTEIILQHPKALHLRCSSCLATTTWHCLLTEDCELPDHAVSFLGLPVLSRADIFSLILQGHILEFHHQNIICAIWEHGGIEFPKSIQILANRRKLLSHVDQWRLWANLVPCEVLKRRSVCVAPQRHILLLSWLRGRLQSNFRTLWNIKPTVRERWSAHYVLLLPSDCNKVPNK